VTTTLGNEEQFGGGPLARIASLGHTALVVEVLFLVTSLPGLAVLVLLRQDPSNAPLAAACAIPLGPALSAALYALRHRGRDLADLHPAADFWRGYRMNALDVLRVWVPWLAGMTVVAVNLSHLDSAHVPGWWALPLVVIALAATLWVMNALVIASMFAFRARDTARLAVYFLIRTPSVPLGNAGLLALAAGITAYTSEAVLALLTVPLAAVLLRTAGPMTGLVEKEFTA